MFFAKVLDINYKILGNVYGVIIEDNRKLRNIEFLCEINIKNKMSKSFCGK